MTNLLNFQSEALVREITVHTVYSVCTFAVHTSIFSRSLIFVLEVFV